jgi:hypothetical protein
MKIGVNNKIITLTVFCIIALNLVSCVYKINETGLDNYKPALSTDGITSELLPCDDFIQKYEYLDGDFEYQEKANGGLDLTSEFAIAWFKYKTDVYKQALEYSLATLDINNKNTKEYNGYTFVEYFESGHNTDKNPNISSWWRYPNKFFMIFYSEERGIIGFISYKAQNFKSDEEKSYSADKDFDVFLKKVYSNYDWES